MKYALLFLTLIFASLNSQAQSDCSLLEIDLQVNPFNTDEMLILVSNPEFQSFNYYGFRVFENGVQIGEETVLFFGIGEESTSQIILDQMPEEGEEVTYTLELWTNFFGELACTFEYTGVPFVTTECYPVVLTVYGSGGGSNVQITVEENVSNSIVLETDLVLSSANTVVSNALCLNPGCYTCSVVTTSGVFSSQLYIDLVSNEASGVQFFYLIGEQGETEVSGNFEVWNGCTVGVDEVDQPLAVYPNPVQSGQLLNFSVPGKVSIHDLSGRLIQSSMHLGALPINLNPGVYLLQDGQNSSRLIVQ